MSDDTTPSGEVSRYCDPDDETVEDAHETVDQYDEDELVDLLAGTVYPASITRQDLNGLNIVALAEDVRQAEEDLADD